MHILDHSNIVALFAITVEPDHYGLVMEYVLHGALEDFLFHYKVLSSFSHLIKLYCYSM